MASKFSLSASSMLFIIANITTAATIAVILTNESPIYALLGITAIVFLFAIHMLIVEPKKAKRSEYLKKLHHQ